MEVILIIVIIVIVIDLIKRGRKAADNVETSSKTNSVYVVRNNQRVKVATFSSGIVFMVGFEGKEAKIGHYDKEGKVYNTDNNMIGFMQSDTRMIISREFPPVYQRTFNLGEVLGTSTGTIFESDMNGCDQYEKGTAYFETTENNLVGVGATYLLLVYEGLVDSLHEKRFRM